MKNKIIKNYITFPEYVKISIFNNLISISGKLGLSKFNINKLLKLKINNNILTIINYKLYSNLNIKSLMHTTITIINNMIYGVNIGYIKHLILYGIGYKAELDNEYLKLSLGYSHKIYYKIPNYVKIICNNNIEIIITGINKQLVGQVASNIRKYRTPDSYKGKGIKYINEKLYLKETKKVK